MDFARRPARLIAALGLCLASPAVAEERVVHSFTQVQWTAPAGPVADEVAHLAPIAGVRMAADGTLFVSTPRWMNAGIPATLSKLVEVDGETRLQPYPSLAAHGTVDPANIQNVLGFVIEGDTLYALDKGDVAGRDETPATAQKIVIIDMTTGEITDRIVIPHDLSNPAENFLNDLAVDTDRGVAYISDSGNRSAPDNQTGILVVDLASKSIRRVLNAHDSTDNDPSVLLTVGGDLVFPDNPLQIGINGIGLSPDGETLYWSQTTGLDFHAIPTAVLRNPDSTDAEIEGAVRNLGQFGGNSDGISVGRDGKVYITDLTNGAIKVYDPETDGFSTLIEDARIIWPDTVDVVPDGKSLVFTSNRLHRAFGGVLAFEPGTLNFEIWRVALD